MAERARADVAWLSSAVLALALLVLALRSGHTFLSDPPVWSDEALFAAPAVDLLQHGAFRTRVLEGVLPSAEHGSYWVPPGYSFLLAGVFGLFSISVEAMRALSMACALGVLLIVYPLARRLQLPRAVALLAPALLALDPVFGRGARVGRMDMLALLLLLAALLVACTPALPPFRRALCSGLLAGLGLTVHPICSVAAPLVLAASLPLRDRAQRAPGAAVAGLVLGALPWLAWIARDPRAFAVQWVAQLIRKDENWAAYGDAPWSAALHFVLARYPPAFHGVLPWLQLAAVLGLALACRRVHAARWLLALHVATWLLVLRGAEMWYALHLTPFLALGLLAPLATVFDQPGRVPAALIVRLRAAPLAVCAALALLFVVPALVDAAEALRWDPPGQGYRAWSTQLARRIPANARVLLAATPDPYFALVTRRDLTVREVLPSGIPFSPEQARALLAATDVVVIGRFVPVPWLLDALKARGHALVTVGKPSDVNHARIVTLSRD